MCLIPPSMFCDGSWLEVDLGRLRGNAAAIQAALGPAGLIAVVKSDAYGHGLGPAAAALARAGVKRFAGRLFKTGKAEASGHRGGRKKKMPVKKKVIIAVCVIAVLAAAIAASKLADTPEPSAAVATTVKLPLVTVRGTLTTPPVETLTPSGAPVSVQTSALLLAVFCKTVAL